MALNVRGEKSNIIILIWAHSFEYCMAQGGDKEQAASMHRLAEFRFLVIAIAFTSSISVFKAC